MLTGKTSVYIDTLKSDDETGDVVPTDDSVENEADDNKIEGLYYSLFVWCQNVPASLVDGN
jgi:hypothetical protein